MMKKIKTNAARILDKLAIAYTLLTYDVDENDLGAENVAAKVGVPVNQSVKTLVARGDKTGVIVACLPGSEALNLKKFAMLSHNKKVELVPVKEVLALTGYIRGGVSPLGMKKNYPVFFEESILQYETIIISAGQRGIQLHLNPRELLLAMPSAVVGSLIETAVD